MLGEIIELRRAPTTVAVVVRIGYGRHYEEFLLFAGEPDGTTRPALRFMGAASCQSRGLRAAALATAALRRRGLHRSPPRGRAVRQRGKSRMPLALPCVASSLSNQATSVGPPPVGSEGACSRGLVACCSVAVNSESA